MYYNGTDYIAATNKALWVPYSEFVKTAEASVFPPHATKAILEDGLLGDIQDSTASGKLDYIAPAVSENKQGKNVVLTFENGEDYLGKVSALYLNGDWRELDEKYYSIEGNTITLSQNLLHVGENALKIVSAGYKPQTVTFTYSKVNEENLSLSAEVNKDAQTVTLTVNGSNGDFLKNLKSVKLGDDAVYGQGVEGSDAVYYEIAENNKSLTLHNVKPGSYQLTLSAEYYEDLTAKFTMEKVDTPDTKTAPEISSYEQKSISDFYGTQYPVYRFGFNGLNATDLKEYLNAVTSVKVNDTTLTKNISSFSFDEKEFRLYSTGSENGGAVRDYDRLDLFASLFKQPGTYTITLTAPDYADVSYELTVSGSTDPTEPTTPTEPAKPEKPSEGNKTSLDAAVESCTLQENVFGGKYYQIKFSSPGGTELTNVLNSIASVIVGSEAYTRASNATEDNTFSLSVAEGWTAVAFDRLNLAANGFSDTSDTTITITTNDNKTLTFTVDKDGNLKA